MQLHLVVDGSLGRAMVPPMMAPPMFDKGSDGDELVQLCKCVGGSYSRFRTFFGLAPPMFESRF